MSACRQFINVLVSDRLKSMYTLRRFDLSRNQFFHPTAEAAAAHAKALPTWPPKQTKMETTNSAAAKEKKKLSGPPPALLNMKPSLCPTTPDREYKMECHPLTETKLLFADSSGRVFRFDADTRCVVTMSSLHSRKDYPLSLAVPTTPATSTTMIDQDEDRGLYIIDETLKPGNKGVQFEAIVYRNRDNPLNLNMGNAWHCDPLPLPPCPYVNSLGYKAAPICSYALVGGDTICISTRGVGIYCFNTKTREWFKAGDWMMPFYGKAEHDPELGLWFGASATNFHLPCAADISGVLRGEEPREQTQIWTDIDVPKGWHLRPYRPTKLVSLGSGRFCITSFFHTLASDSSFDQLPDETFAVFTGVEAVLPHDGNGNAKGVTLMKHKSVTCRTHDSNMIESVV
ncbi:unnamed protein product [Alopecurus aequalis]